MKKILSGIIAGTLALTLSLGAHADAVNLTDVTPGTWFYNEVSAMVAAGYIDGYEDGTFRPDQTVTVVEAVTMAARMTGAPTGEAEGYWGGLQMDNAYRSGWITEDDVPRGSYDGPVTRELACKIIAAALGLGYPAGTVLPFADSQSVGDEYIGSVMALYANGLLDGYEDNTLRPQATLTRAQAATLLYRAAGVGSVYPDNCGGLFLRRHCQLLLRGRPRRRVRRREQERYKMDLSGVLYHYRRGHRGGYAAAEQPHCFHKPRTRLPGHV